MKTCVLAYEAFPWANMLSSTGLKARMLSFSGYCAAAGTSKHFSASSPPRVEKGKFRNQALGRYFKQKVHSV